jgi:hypothetical protein
MGAEVLRVGEHSTLRHLLLVLLITEAVQIKRCASMHRVLFSTPVGPDTTKSTTPSIYCAIICDIGVLRTQSVQHRSKAW